MSLPALIGHQDVCARLEKLWQGQRWPHALMLTGAQGIGKRLMAEHIMRRIMAGEAPLIGEKFPQNYEADAPVVSQLNAGSCADAQIIEPEEGKRQIKAAQVRTALQKLSLTASGTYRFCIVDAADQLTTAAANVLLKTLEEPSGNVYFIVLAHQVAQVLPTICSRCQIVQCAPLSSRESLKVIQRAWPETSLDHYSSLSYLAGGAPGSVLAQEKKDILNFLNSDNLHAFLESLPATAQSVWLINRLFSRALKQAASGDLKVEIAELHTHWQRDLAQQQEYNLSLAWLIEHYQPQFQKVLT